MLYFLGNPFVDIAALGVLISNVGKDDVANHDSCEQHDQAWKARITETAAAALAVT